MKKIITLFILATIPSLVFGKDDWHMQLHNWAVRSQSNPKCKVWYTTGIYRPGRETSPAWGVMTEKMFKWFSTKGEKIAPTACVATVSNMGSVRYRILISATPVRTQTQTIHGADKRTQTAPTQTTINARTTYPDGNSSTTTGTLSGTETTTMVVPTETTYTQSTATVYLYVYRVDDSGWHLLTEDQVNYNREGVRGSGDNLAAAELGVGLKNMISASKDKHRVDKLYQSAMEAIATDSGGDQIR